VPLIELAGVRNFTFNHPAPGIVELFRGRPVYRDRLGFKLAGL
jgi:hypothetical protein